MSAGHGHPQLYAVLRVLVSLALLGFVLRGVDLQGLYKTLRASQPALIGLAALVLVFSPLMSVPRWQAILGCFGYRISALPLFRALYVGAFFSQVLPSTVGGDIWRVWICTRSGVPLPIATFSIVIERLAGLSAAVICLAVSFPWLLNRVGDDPVKWVLILLLCACIGLVGAIVLLPVVGARIPYLRGGSMDELIRVLGTIGRSSRLLLMLLGTAAGGQAVAVVAYYLLALSIGSPLSLLDCAATFAPALLITLIPVSFGGWGLREGAFVVILSFYGVSREQALTLSVLFGLTLLISTLPGLIIWSSQRVGWNSALGEKAV